MRPRPALLVVCLLVTAFAAMPLSARDFAQPQLPSAGWLEAVTGWVASLWEGLFGLSGGAEPGRQDPKSLEVPPPAPYLNENEEGEATPGGSCIDPNGPPNCGSPSGT